jgi:hypothetical protein
MQYFGVLVNVRNTLIREVILFSLLMISVFFVSKTLVNRAGVNVVDAVFSIMDSDLEDTKSIMWFINHPTDTRQQIEQCRQSSRLRNSKNCLNADSAEQISRQPPVITYSKSPND